MIPPIAGIYLVNVKLGTAVVPRQWHMGALASWLIGSGWAALAPRWGLALTPVAALDSMLISAAAYAGLRWILKSVEDQTAASRPA